MHPHLAAEPEFIAMFLDEARLAARIRHPNVVSTLDVQSDSEGVFLVMEYIEGPSLTAVFRALSRQTRRLPLDIILRVFLDALAGLHAAHELRDSNERPLHLVHRDVSPQNILIGVDGISRITDFGVVSAEARLSSTNSGQLKGKLGYMSPEQARSEPVDRRTDVYAAGALLWEILTAGRRFRSGSEADILAQVENANPPRPRDINPNVPPALDECCMRAIAREAKDRWPTAADFAEALEKAAADSEITIASTRAVAAFVTELQAHERPVDLPAPRPALASFQAPLSASRPSFSNEIVLPVDPPTVKEALPAKAAPEAKAAEAPEGPASAPPSSAAATPLATASTLAGPPSLEASESPSPPAAEPASERSPAFGSSASLGEAAPQRSSQRRLFWGIAAVALAVLVGATLVARRGDSAAQDAKSPPAAEPGGSGAGAAKGAPSVPVPDTRPSAAPTATQTAAEPPAATSAAPSAKPVVTRTPAVSDAPGTARSTGPAKPPSTPATTEKPAATSPVYRPPEL
jgi:serine/threonine-protein kinase